MLCAHGQIAEQLASLVKNAELLGQKDTGLLKLANTELNSRSLDSLIEPMI